MCSYLVAPIFIDVSRSSYLDKLFTTVLDPFYVPLCRSDIIFGFVASKTLSVPIFNARICLELEI